MLVVLPTPEASVVARFSSGDENALVTLYRQEYDSLLAAASELLGRELSHFRGRVAHKAMLDAWHARERFLNPVAFSAFLEEAVRQEADIQRRKHAALHRREGRGAAHVTVGTVDDAVRELLQELHAPVVDPALAAEEARTLKRTHAAEHVERVAGRPKWLLYGAIGVVIVASIIGAQRMLDVAGTEVAVDRAFKSDDVQTLTSNKGQRGSVTLRDGTQVTMGSETRVRIPSEFGVTQRTVELDGTATFAVGPSSNPKLPAFAVRAGTVTVTTTGTIFTVRHYTDEASVVVQVTQGTVELKDRVSGVMQVISAGEALRFANGAAAPLNGIARDVALAWTRDSIVFDNAPLGQVIPELVRWFGMNAVLIDPSAAARPVSMRLALDSSGEAARVLTQTANLTMSFGKDDRLEFSGAPAAK
ncbi:FecR domain-containing protein [Gemmatimonas sp.]|uniref:FecR domain-containing protein n=1 Tax=Gemmatimonas sp. TaxID=1962908 RepID=UPI0037C16AA0